jgi:hypothetical protein
VRLIAFYLPQYHPIPENDRWWGPGFTEWRNVARARPLFRGHEQPHEPGELGYYDLRAPETRIAQAELARAHGISGFCYYHYWFSGKRLLERPFDEVLASGQPDFPFCLCWANHSWTRRWFGAGEVLQEQRYSRADIQAHARWLVRAFEDRRYLRIDQRPVFVVYRPRDLPTAAHAIAEFRNTWAHAGIPEPYLIGADAFCPGTDCRHLGFDATLSFEPKFGALPGANVDGLNWRRLWHNIKLGVASARLRLYDERDARRRMAVLRAQAEQTSGAVAYPCTYVRWDNTPRRATDGIVMVNQRPEHFEWALDQATAAVSRAVVAGSLPDRLVFVDAWNEWGEGNHLEPDVRYGRAYLEACLRVVRRACNANNDDLQTSRRR